MLRLAPSLIAGLKVTVPEAKLPRKALVRDSVLPEMLYPLPVKVTVAKTVPAAKSFALASRAAPAGKNKVSPTTGATPPCQLAWSVQLALVVEAPFQVRV